MNDEERKIVGTAHIEIFESLQSSLRTASGAAMSIDMLENISAMQLLSILSTNHIRFIFRKPVLKKL